MVVVVVVVRGVVQYFFQYVGPTFSAEFFDELASHVSSCIHSYRDTLDHDRRQASLKTLFHMCDQTKVNGSIYFYLSKQDPNAGNSHVAIMRRKRRRTRAASHGIYRATVTM